MNHLVRNVGFLMVLSPALAACSIRPLPETFPLNFPRASTYDIIQKVRCEAKAGLDRFKNTQLEDHANRVIKATSIGYDFQFVMTETNSIDAVEDGGAKFAGVSGSPSGKPKGSVNLTGSATKTRQDTRTFRLVEDLEDIAKADCAPATRRANVAYPISGSLRVDDIAHTYVSLETTSNLDEISPNPIANAPRKRNGVFSEHLNFNTRVGLGATPTVTLSVNIGSLGLNSASAGAAATRYDQHSLIIAFAQDPNFHDAEVRRAIRERKVLLARRYFDGSEKKAVRTPRLETALAQANAVSRNNVLLELGRLRSLKDDEIEAPKFLGQRLLTFLRPPDETLVGE